MIDPAFNIMTGKQKRKKIFKCKFCGNILKNKKRLINHLGSSCTAKLNAQGENQ